MNLMHSTSSVLLNLQAALNAGFQWIKHHWSNDVSVIDVRSKDSDVGEQRTAVHFKSFQELSNERTVDRSTGG